VASAIALTILIALIVLLTLAARRALRLRGPVDLTYLALAASAACLAPNATVAFSTALRNTAFLLVLVPFVFAAAPLLPAQGNKSSSLRRRSLRLDTGSEQLVLRR
jgi:asparagine N-glycosylation enzyme membrane subunit Stt3